MKTNTGLVQSTTTHKKSATLKEVIALKVNLEIRHETNWRRIQGLEAEQRQLETEINKAKTPRKDS